MRAPESLRMRFNREPGQRARDQYRKRQVFLAGHPAGSLYRADDKQFVVQWDPRLRPLRPGEVAR